jgi:hypothetical protein
MHSGVRLALFRLLPQRLWRPNIFFDFFRKTLPGWKDGLGFWHCVFISAVQVVACLKQYMKNSGSSSYNSLQPACS